VLGQVGRVPVAVDVGLVALQEALRHRHLAGGGVEDRRVAVAVGERRGEVVLREPGHLAEHALGRVDVELLEGGRPEGAVGAEDLEQVELDVAQVALVVTHVAGGSCVRSGGY
jgi:hypothetical protein